MDQLILFLLLVLVSALFTPCISCDVAVAFSSGFPSHNSMGAKIVSDLNASGISTVVYQIRVVEYNLSRDTFNNIKSKARFHIYSHNLHLGDQIIKWGQKTYWRCSLPFDFPSLIIEPFTSPKFFAIYEMLHKQCNAVVNSANSTFMTHFDEINNSKLLIIDWVLNECFLQKSSAFRSTTPIVLVNFILLGHYREMFGGIPVLPSYTPDIFAGLSPSMTLRDRLRCALEYVLSFFQTRFLCTYSRHTFHNIINYNRDVPDSDFQDTLKTAIFKLSFIEPIIEMARPLTNRLKLVGTGVSLCEYQEMMDYSQSIGIPIDNQAQIIIVSFGSADLGQRMPKRILLSMLDVFFQQSNYTVIWANYFAGSRTAVVKNCVLLGWAPLAKMLRDPRTKLLITHGGINTIGENGFRTPGLVFALHSDQKYNAARLRDFGVIEGIEPWQNSKSLFKSKLIKLFSNRKKYERNLSRLRAMHISLMQLYNSKNNKSIKSYWMSYSAKHGQTFLKTPSFLGQGRDFDIAFRFGMDITISSAFLTCLLFCLADVYS